jgi:hypothetical protein
MRLTDLEPQFVRYVTQSRDEQFAEGRVTPAEYLHHVNTLDDAQGIVFLCPACFAKNGGSVGTHGIEVAFANRGVKDHQGSKNREGKPSRWNAAGTNYSDLTTTPSILIDPAEPICPGWHGYITKGEAA